MTANFLVAAQGPLSEPALPEVPGLEDFEGRAFHSARWDHEHDLTGERVAVVGTGASAIQFVPEIQPKVGRLHVFQRTAPWVIPHRNRPMKSWERTIYRLFPPAQLAMRAAIYWARELFVLQFRHRAVAKLVERIPLTHLRRQVKDAPGPQSGGWNLFSTWGGGVIIGRVEPRSQTRRRGYPCQAMISRCSTPGGARPTICRSARST